jgi:hypothetical protein
MVIVLLKGCFHSITILKLLFHRKVTLAACGPVFNERRCCLIYPIYKH